MVEKFAYRVSLGIWMSVFSGVLAVGVVLATVSYQSLKAVRANPIDSLHYE